MRLVILVTLILGLTLSYLTLSNYNVAWPPEQKQIRDKFQSLVISLADKCSLPYPIKGEPFDSAYPKLIKILECVESKI